MFTAAEKVRDVYGYDPFKAIIAPRPIGWISTVSKQGVPNLAPYSFFNAVGSNPNMLGFNSSGIKHTLINCQDTGEFVFNLVSADLVEAMNQTSAALEAGMNEFEFAKLGQSPSVRVKPPRVTESPAAIECRVVSIQCLKDLEGRDTTNWFVIGQVVGLYIDPAFVTEDKRFDTAKAAITSRCGYMDYMSPGPMFELLRPE
jgi:flavin reductase (DIM6/NTAB) family NADH-FMN oxidoreductase RutF